WRSWPAWNNSVRAALDADIAQAQKQRAVRLAVALDAKQFAAGVGALNLRLEILVPPTLAVPFGRGGKGRGGDQDECKNGNRSHGQAAWFISCGQVSRSRRRRHRAESMRFTASRDRPRDRGSAEVSVCAETRGAWQGTRDSLRGSRKRQEG